MLQRAPTAPGSVVGYHGCAAQTARELLAGADWDRSGHEYDWLGCGIYFWEYGPDRALRWAHDKFGGDAAVIQAKIRLGSCLNLLDSEHVEGLSQAYELGAEAARLLGRDLPRNHADWRHFLDRFVIDLYCRRWELGPGIAFQTVRGCFPEGEPVFPDSRILAYTHVQVAVRDPGCIGPLQRVS